MQLNPYLFFDGKCEAAFKFYEQTLGAKIEAMMPYEGSPPQSRFPPRHENGFCTQCFASATRS